MKKFFLCFALPAPVVIILDQISKLIIARMIPLYQSVPIIDGLFNLVHVRNRGMAFGLMNRPDPGYMFYLLVFASIVAIIMLIIWAIIQLLKGDWEIPLGLSLILGGAIGNLIDRIRLKEVIDFLDFYVGSYHWPSFNIADSAITVGTFWLAINILKAQGARRRAQGSG